MKYSKAVLVAVALLVSVTMSYAGAVNLSQKISETYPWPEYGGKCAPLYQGEARDYLPCNTPAAVSFSGCWVQGYLLAGEGVIYRVEKACGDGEWRQIVRIVRCGNPASGRYWHKNPEPVVQTCIQERVVDRPYGVPCDPVVRTSTTYLTEVMEVEKPVETVRWCPLEYEVPAMPQRYRPSAVTAVQRNSDTRGIATPGVDTSDYRAMWTMNAQWTRSSATTTSTPCLPPAPPPDDGTCGPPPPGGVPSPTPGDAAGPGNGGIDPGLGQPGGYTPPPAVPPGYSDGGNAAPPTAGPPTPPVGGVGPDVPATGTGPVTPWSGNAAPAF